MSKKLETTITLLEHQLIVYKRENNGVWQCRYKVDGKWQRNTTKAYELEQAKVVAKEMLIEAEIRKRKNLPAITRRFGDLAKTVVKKMREDIQINPSAKGVRTYKDYILVIENYLIPILGKKLVTNIDRVALDELEEKRIKIMGKVPSRSTVLTHNAALNKVFREAIGLGYLTELQKPLLEVKGLKGKVRPAFTIEEIHALLAKFEEWITKSNNKQSVLMRELMFDYINVLLDTGARPGRELLDLRWQQIKASIKPVVKKTGEQDEHGDVEISNLNQSVLMTVDGKTGERDIVGMKRTVDALVRIAKRNYQVEFPLVYPLKNVARADNDDLVFVTLKGERPTNFNNMFTSFLKEHNLLIDPKTKQNRVLYSLRHTYATLALEHDKVPIHTLTKQMGTSVAMIEKHYSKLKVIQAIDQLRGEESRQLINAGGVIDEMYESNKSKGKSK